MGQLASDDFNRADSADLGTNWDVISGSTGPLNVNNNQARWNINVDDGSEVYNGGITWPDDQYSEADIIGSSGSTGVGFGVCVRGSLGTNFYRIVVGVGAATDLEIGKFISAAYTVLGVAVASGWVSGDRLRTEIAGSTLSMYKNGSLVTTRTDTSITTGKPGLAYSSLMDAARADNWAGGDLVTTFDSYDPIRDFPQTRFGPF